MSTQNFKKKPGGYKVPLLKPANLRPNNPYAKKPPSNPNCRTKNFSIQSISTRSPKVAPKEYLYDNFNFGRIDSEDSHNISLSTAGQILSDDDLPSSQGNPNLSLILSNREFLEDESLQYPQWSPMPNKKPDLEILVMDSPGNLSRGWDENPNKDFLTNRSINFSIDCGDSVGFKKKGVIDDDVRFFASLKKSEETVVNSNKNDWSNKVTAPKGYYPEFPIKKQNTFPTPELLEAAQISQFKLAEQRINEKNLYRKSKPRASPAKTFNYRKPCPKIPPSQKMITGLQPRVKNASSPGKTPIARPAEPKH